jgi:hypothetical protein
MNALFLDQGYTQNSTQGPFDDYLALGMGNTPMVNIYEAQYVAQVIKGDGSIKPDMVLMYPSPTVLSKHTLTGTADQVYGADAQRLRDQTRYLQDRAGQSELDITREPRES